MIYEDDTHWLEVKNKYWDTNDSQELFFPGTQTREGIVMAVLVVEVNKVPETARESHDFVVLLQPKTR